MRCNWLKVLSALSGRATLPQKANEEGGDMLSQHMPHLAAHDCRGLRRPVSCHGALTVLKEKTYLK